MAGPNPCRGVGIDDGAPDDASAQAAPANGDSILAGVDDGVVLKNDVRAGGKTGSAVERIDDGVRRAIRICDGADALAVAAVTHHHGRLLLAVAIAAAAQDGVAH